MKTGVLTMALAFAATFAFLTTASMSGAGTDVDGADADGIQQNIDNCTGVFNPLQLDSDRDGYGNSCDQDADQNGLVGGSDFGLWKLSLGKGPGDPGYNPDVEWDSDTNALIGGSDFGVWKQNLGLSPTGGRACADALIDVNAQHNLKINNTVSANTGFPINQACPDVNRRGTYTASGPAGPPFP